MPATTASATRSQLWIEPSGQVHEFEDEKHGQWAMQHLGMAYHKPLEEDTEGFTKEIPEDWKDDLEVEEDAQSMLLDQGWIRMGFFRRRTHAVVYLQKHSPLTTAELDLAQRWIQTHPEWQGPEIDVADPRLESYPMADFLAANKPTDLRRLLVKQAAGPVPIPTGVIDKVYRAIVQNVRAYWGNSEEPVGERKLELAFSAEGATVTGEARTGLSVQLVFEDAYLSRAVRGAEMYPGKWPRLVVYFSGKLTGQEISKRLEGLEGFYLKGILTHELTHAFDALPEDEAQIHDPKTNPTAYYNSDHEIRAYATQLWHYVITNADYYREGGAQWLAKTGEKGLWSLVDSALTMRIGANLRRYANPKNRRYILQVAYRAMQEILESPESKAASLKIAQDAGITKADLQRIRPILREWVGGGWTDGPQLMRLLEKHKDILAKFRMSKPVRLWRNERAQTLTRGGQDVTGPSNAGWEDQYTRPSAWSATRMHAESYASGNGRRLVTAIVPPEDTYCYIPLVEQAARALGMKTFDPHQQDEVIVRPNPSFLDQIRPKVTVGEEAQLRRDYELALVEYHLPQLHELRKTNPKAISDEELKRRIADIAKHKEIHDVRDELAKLQRGKAARKNAGILEPGFSVEAACRPTRYRAMTAAQAMNYQPKRVYDEDVLVTLDVSKVDTSWRRDKTFYIEPGGGNQLRGRYDRFAQWLQDSPGTPIDPPDIGLTPSGEIIFGNGRHRFAVLRDQGAKRIAATVPKQDFKTMAERFGAQPVQGTSITASWAVQALVGRAKQLTKQDPLSEALGPYECGAFDGGCLICAEALISAAGRGDLVRLVDVKGRTHHYGARIDGLYCDFSGAYPSGDMWAKTFARLEHVREALHAEEGLDPNYQEEETPRDPQCSREIAQLLLGSKTAKTLYHGTSVENAKSIQRHGLEPQVGDLTATAYEDDAESVGEELEPLTFAGDKDALQRGVYSAMLHAIQAEGHDITDAEQAIRNWGALVILRDGDEVMDYRHPDDGVTNPTEHPMQVEPEDYYSRDNVAIDYILTGPTLVRYLKRHGVNMERWTRPFSEQKRNALVGMVRRAHPDVPVEKIVEKVNALTFEQFHKSWDYYTKLERSRAAKVAGLDFSGWYDPWNAKLHALGDNVEHSMWAKRYMKKQNPEFVGTGNEALRSLFKVGWIRVRHAKDTTYFEMHNVTPRALGAMQTLVMAQPSLHCQSVGLSTSNTGDAIIPLQDFLQGDMTSIKAVSHPGPGPKVASADAVSFQEHSISAGESSFEGTKHPGVRVEALLGYDTVGVLEYYLDGDNAYVRGITVAPHYRGQGLGQQLYDEGIASARRHGATAFYSDQVNAMSPDAHKAWSRIRQRHPVTFEPGEGGYDSTGRHRIELKTGALTKGDIEGRRRALEAFFPAELVQAAIDEAPDTYTMPKDEAVEEHERLIEVLRSPDHTDDLQEADEQEGELQKIKTAGSPTIGFNVNDSEMPWTEMILAGKKTIETRDSDSLRPHIGERVGIVRTGGRGPAALVGYCTLGEPKVYRTNAEFRADNASHRIPDGPQWDLQPGAVKFGYPLADVEACEPKRVEGQGRVFRRIAAPLGDAAWQHILSRFPKEFQAEVLAERSGKSLEDIQELQNWRLTSRAPVVIPLNAAFIQQQCEAMHLPAEVVQRINEMWGLGLRPSGQVHDPNPERYFRYAQMPAATANPSIMLGPDIVWGVGRFVAACLRGDRSLRVWKLGQGKSASFLTKDDIKAYAREIEQRTGKSSRQLLEEMHVSQDGDAFPGFVKEAKPIEVPGELLDALVSTVIPFLETEAAAVSPAQWLHEVSAGEARWSWHVGALVQRHLGDVGSAFPQLRMQVGFDRAKRFPQNRVTEAWSDPSTGVISILMAQPPTYHPIPTALVADLRQSLAHELAHLQQAAYQGVGAYTNRMREIAPTKNPDTFINTNYEVKAISAEFAEAFSRALHGDPTLSVEQFLSTQWQWPHIQEGMAPDARARILKDLAYVATHASAPKRGRRHSDHGSHRRASQNSVFYHGTRHDGPKPGLTGILWLTEDLHAAAVDATTHAHHGDPGCWKLTLDPQAHLVALWDLDVPAVRTVKDEASQHHAHITGRGVTDEEWVRASANGPRLETLPWMLRRLLDLGVDGVYVHEPVAGRKQLALALLNQDVVTSQEPAPLTHDAEVHHHVVGSRE